MAEMIIPGTYISVRAEGLISAGRIATGVVGVVGTAMSGPIGEPVTLSGFADGRELFGLPDDYAQPDDGANPLSLVRSLALLYNNGASSVIAVRVAGGTAASATYAVRDKNGDSVAVLTARTPGTWANDMQVSVEPAEDDCRVRGETQAETFAKLRYAPVRPSPENRLRVQRGATRRTDTLQVVYKQVVTVADVAPQAGTNPPRYFLPGVTSDSPVEEVAAVNRVRVLDASGGEVRSYSDPNIIYGTDAPQKGELRVNKTSGELVFEASEVPAPAQRVEARFGQGHADPSAGQVLVTTWSGDLKFATGEAPKKGEDTLVASYVVDRARCVRVSLSDGATVERYTVADGEMLAKLVNESSSLAAAEPDATRGGNSPAPGAASYFGTGSNTAGNNGADAGRDEYAAGLDLLSNMTVNLVLLAGQDAARMGDVLLGHLNQTAESDRERIGVIGAAGTRAADFLGHTLADERVVLVAPGIKYPDGLVLPPPYAAAAVAGTISSLPVQASLTNKTVNLPGLSVAFNRGEQEQLIRRNVLTLVDKEGFRVVKGVTTAGEGTPFSSIPTRRIVDYAKYGVRSAANSYLGKLNNSRVRGALKATLDAFLTRMVEDEALTGYELEVTATRAQEIAGEVNVAMTLLPTFSIEYIRVTMILK
ncbi:MAG TPA: phage tail sheath C-terminal domain-containing protein [Pyrinomonadaceae bacterium]|nr:phage tail sheath C-terminal domain-containing protein [Pyrinomonadaceae bacterium]